MTPLALLFTLAAIGIAETSYLIKKRKALEKPVCLLNENCSKVLESQYNKAFLIHNDLLGLLFYIALGFITAFLVTEIGPNNLLTALTKILLLGGTLASLFFIYLQWKVIKAWCLWCIISALTIFLMAIITLTAI